MIYIYIYILHPQIPDFQIAYLFSFQLMFKSQFQIIDSYDWFCGPWSHLCNAAFHNSDCIERNLHSCTEMHVNIRIGLVSDMNAWWKCEFVSGFWWGWSVTHRSESGTGFGLWCVWSLCTICWRLCMNTASGREWWRHSTPEHHPLKHSHETAWLLTQRYISNMPTKIT